jgi:glutamyl-tRNA synthetase
MTVVTRIPPSPTGRMHIGTARTALYNWLFAKHHNGKMLFRIEDTDRERFAPEYVDSIVKGLTWLGLDWSGEIFSQFEHRARHAEIARQLVAQGRAYHCYCSPAELEEMRERAKAEGRVTFYDRRWRDRPAADAPPGIEPVIRIKAPLDGDTVVHDHVQGDVRVENVQLDDFILLRSDGTPTYMLAVVVDDHDMGVTHVIRGDDHLNNTFRQNLIYEALNWPLPEYAHLPLILGPDGAKLSKRHGATSVEEYETMGYLPEAMRNYLLRLGWSHGDDEIIPTGQAIQWFDLDHIGRSPARFDFAKLDSLNAHYIKLADNARLLSLCKPIFAERLGLTVDEAMAKKLLACMDELKTRAKTLVQITDESAFLGKTAPLQPDEKAAAILSTDEARTILKALAEAFKTLEPFTADTIQSACKQIADQLAGGKLGKIGMPLRAALTGTTVSPSVFHAAEILGREETLIRIITGM